MKWRYFIDDATGTAIRVSVSPSDTVDQVRALYRETDALEYAAVARKGRALDVGEPSKSSDALKMTVDDVYSAMAAQGLRPITPSAKALFSAQRADALDALLKGDAE